MPDGKSLRAFGVAVYWLPFIVLRLRVTDAADLTFSLRVMAICFYIFNIRAGDIFSPCGQRSQMIGLIAKVIKAKFCFLEFTIDDDSITESSITR